MVGWRRRHGAGSEETGDEQVGDRRPRGRADGSEQVSRREGAVDTVFEAIAEGLAKEEGVRIAGFGTFGTRSRAARTGRNPRTGESVPIPASKSPSFKAAKRLREAVKRGWQEEQAEPGGNHQGRPGGAGAMLEMSDWPGGVEPVWTVLEPDSMEALRAGPLADNPTLRLGGRSAGRGVRRIGVRAQCADRARTDRQRVLAEVYRERAFRARHGCGDARGDDLAGDGGDRAVPRGKGAARGRRVGASSAASADGVGRAHGRTGIPGPVDPPGARDARTGKTGRPPGGPVQAPLLAREPLAIRGDVSPRAAGPVAAGRYRRDPLGALGKWSASGRARTRSGR